MTALELNNISFSYGRQPVLQGLSGQIRKGEFLCVAGASGSGKSTLLRLLAGLELPQSGSIRVFGKTVTGPDTDRAVVFQQDPLFPWMRVEKQVAFAIRCTGAVDKKTALKQAREILARVELVGAEKKYPCQLSGGMKQRVALARAMAMGSEILLLDEAFGALDVQTREIIHNLLLELWIKKNLTVVCVTHDLQEALTLADRIWLLRDGRIADEMTVSLPRPRTCVQEEELAEKWFRQGETT